MTAPAKIPVAQTAPTQPRLATNMFTSLQREIDRLFDDFAFTPHRRLGDVTCKMDLAETKDGLELTVEVPGLEEKDVKIEVADGRLTVSGEKTFEAERKDKAYHFVERGYGSFSRTIELPDGAKADDIKAKLAKGVLTVTIPTPARPEPKTIPVQASA